MHTVNHDWTIANSRPIRSLVWFTRDGRHVGVLPSITVHVTWTVSHVDRNRRQYANMTTISCKSHWPRVTGHALRAHATGASTRRTRGRWCYVSSINQSINRIRQHAAHTRTASSFIACCVMLNSPLPPQLDTSPPV